MKVFLDTNIIFDFLLDSRGPFHHPAVELFTEMGSGKIDAVFSATQATDIYYSIRKAVGNDRARDCLRKLYAICEVVDTSAAACIDALDSRMDDYEDAVQAETAAIAGCDVIVTRDLDDYANCDIDSMDAEKLLELLA